MVCESDSQLFDSVFLLWQKDSLFFSFINIQIWPRAIVFRNTNNEWDFNEWLKNKLNEQIEWRAVIAPYLVSFISFFPSIHSTATHIITYYYGIEFWIVFNEIVIHAIQFIYYISSTRMSINLQQFGNILIFVFLNKAKIKMS